MMARRRIDEFGETERYCRRCVEWWPDDAEFWYLHGTGKQMCKACQKERMRKRKEGQPMPRRMVMGPAICKEHGDHVWLWTPEDGRRKGFVWEHHGP